MALLDLLGRRWQLRLLWEMRDGQSFRFRALQDATGVSPSVLNTRLAECVDTGLVERTPEGYALSADGRSLLDLLLPLNDWANAWAERLNDTCDT
jgi:DNA-binding HxlR family transcriptional regulator